MDPIALCVMVRNIFPVRNNKLFVLDTYMTNVMQISSDW